MSRSPSTRRCGRSARLLSFALLFAATSTAAIEGAGSGAAPDPSSVPAWVIALARDIAPLAELAATDDGRWNRLPVLRTHALGVPADGRADATAALQAALDSLSSGGTLAVDRGEHDHALRSADDVADKNAFDARQRRGILSSAESFDRFIFKSEPK